MHGHMFNLRLGSFELAIAAFHLGFGLFESVLQPHICRQVPVDADIARASPIIVKGAF